MAIARTEVQKMQTTCFFIPLVAPCPPLLAMVDEGKIAFTIGVELSYLSEEEQYELHAVMDLEQCTPSLSQANRMKRMSQRGELGMDAISIIQQQADTDDNADLDDDFYDDVIAQSALNWMEKDRRQNPPALVDNDDRK